ncbi:MAG: cysteine desulfurase [Clostridia bacterium]|nr:cysteine desulfurase [Clostridia bacterium]
MIYLDNAATTQIDSDVLDAMLPYLKGSFGNSQSQHAFGRTAADAVLNARDKIAKLLGCRSEELYFVSGGTEANNTALKGICLAKGSGHILVSAIEHPSMIESAKDMAAQGFEVTFINPDENGVITPQTVESAIKEDTIFCAVMAANNETGVIQPVKEIGEICRKHKVFYFADCVQYAATNQLSVDFCDGLSISAHKLYGPKGAGLLYIKSGNKFSRLISGGMQERGFRGGTVNVAAVAGLSAAVEKAVKNQADEAEKIRKVKEHFVNRVLKEIHDTHLNGGGKILPSHANISFDGCDGENVLFALDLKGIAVSTGSACSAGAVNPSHVLTAMGLSPQRVKSAVRFSFGKHNTLSEADEAVEALKNIVSKIRSI